MKKLILMRHAKSDWSQNEPDNRRPLNPRGRTAAPRMAEWLRDSSLWPDVLLCSTATRTMETWQLMEEISRHKTTTVEFLDELYLAHELVILSDALRPLGSDGFMQTLMVLGHNPGIENLVSLIAGVPLENAYGGCDRVLFSRASSFHQCSSRNLLVQTPNTQEATRMNVVY